MGATPQIGEMLPLCDFFCLTVLSCPFLFSRSCAQVEPLDRFSRFMAHTTCFRPKLVFLGVRTMGDHIWGNMPPNLPPPKGVNRQFQAKTAKYKNRNIAKTINRIKTIGSRPNLRTELIPTIALRGLSNITHIKSSMAAGRHLEKMDMTS